MREVLESTICDKIFLYYQNRIMPYRTCKFGFSWRFAMLLQNSVLRLIDVILFQKLSGLSGRLVNNSLEGVSKDRSQNETIIVKGLIYESREKS